MRCLFPSDRYRPLPRFGHKTRFLIDVQVPILELYHTRISESLDAFETLSSFLVRAVPGALAGQSGHGTDTKRMTTGVEGVQRLVKAFVSAKWMGGVMASWGEDVVSSIRKRWNIANSRATVLPRALALNMRTLTTEQNGRENPFTTQSFDCSR